MGTSHQEELERRYSEIGITGYLTHGEVEESFRLVLETGAHPISLSSIQMKAMLKMRRKDLKEAEHLIWQAIQIKPDDPINWKMRGDCAFLQTKYAAAEEYYKQALKHKPDGFEILHDLGVATVSQGRVQECLAYFAKAIELAPNRPEFQHHLALMLILAGQDAAGWDRMQARLNVPGVLGTFPFPEKYWKGEPLTGKTIVLRAEQGWGDTIMFSRYLPWFTARAKKVYFYGQRAMCSFIAHYFPEVEAWENDVPPPMDHDYHCSIMCFPRLIPEPMIAPRKKETKGQGIGFCWYGSPTHQADHLRSVPVEMFEPLAAAAKQKLLSLGYGYFWQLQNGVPVGHSKPEFCEYVVPRCRDWLETAKVVRELSLVITVDTAIAHLAGFLGVETWLLLPKVPDFRWGMEGETTHWYPSMKLYRQDKILEWKPVFERVANDLKAR